MTGVLFCLLLFCIPLVHAKFLATDRDQYCVYGCDAVLSYVKFNDKAALKSADNSFVAKCSSKIRAASLFFCAAKYCSPHEIAAGLSAQNQSCWDEAGMLYPSYVSLLQTIPAGGIDNITTFSKPAGKTDPAFNSTAIPSEKLFKESLDTIAAYYNNTILSRQLAYGIYAIWGFVVLLGMANRAMGIIRRRSARTSIKPIVASEGGQKKGSAASTFWRRHLILPALFNGRCQQSLGPLGTLPPRLESVVIVIFFLYILVCLFPGYHVVLPNLWWSQSSVQLAHEISDRAGNLAIANIPVLWFFSIRNDPFLWATGWTFATFNAFHRWIARITMLLVIIHPAAYTIAAVRNAADEYTGLLAKPYFLYGIAAVCIYSAIIGTSAYFFRRRFYDFWLIAHIVLAVGFIATIFYHISVWNGKYSGFIWASVAIWVFDRVVRFARLSYSKLHSRGAKALATYNHDSDIIRLDVSDFFRNTTQISSGSYYFVYQPGTLRGWESHPFTLCAWRELIKDTAPQAADQDPSEKSSTHKSTSSASIHDAHGTTRLRHSFLIRPRSGFTGRLKKQLLAKQGSEEQHFPLQVVLEGPYGSATDLHKYSNILMIAGGSGITPVISQAYSLLGSSTAIHIIWAVRERGYCEEVCSNEMAALLKAPRFKLDVYVTSTSKEGRSEASARYGIHHGRPDVPALLTDGRRECSNNLAVVCCGPEKMADESRQAVVHLLGEAGPDVFYFNEAFGW